MQKRTKITIYIISAILMAAFLVIYFFFPKMWGSALYPLKYQDYIVKYSKEYDVDPSFASAIIFSESRFNSESISRVGARGLMQIMPETGRSIAGQLGESDYSVSKLDDPETNIRYGIWYIKDLLNRYDQDEEAALAGYNGGPGVANRYVISRSAASIPHETAGYIKTVMNAVGKYKELYFNELYPDQVLQDVMEKMKLPIKQEKTWLQKLLSIFSNQ